MAVLSGIYRITVGRGVLSPRYYVGQSVNAAYRLCGHRSSLRGGYHRNDKLQKAYAKYGESAFRFEIIVICRITDLTLYEHLILCSYKKDEIFNIMLACVSAPLGLKQSEATKQKRRDALLGRPRPPDVIARISASKKGKPKSDEHRIKIGLSQRGRKQSRQTIERRIEGIKRCVAARRLSWVLEAM